MILLSVSYISSSANFITSFKLSQCTLGRNRYQSVLFLVGGVVPLLCILSTDCACSRTLRSLWSSCVVIFKAELFSRVRRSRTVYCRYASQKCHVFLRNLHFLWRKRSSACPDSFRKMFLFPVECTAIHLLTFSSDSTSNMLKVAYKRCQIWIYCGLKVQI